MPLGTWPIKAALGLTRRIAEELRDRGTYTAMAEPAIPYAELQAGTFIRKG